MVVAQWGNVFHPKSCQCFTIPVGGWVRSAGFPLEQCSTPLLIDGDLGFYYGVQHIVDRYDMMIQPVDWKSYTFIYFPKFPLQANILDILEIVIHHLSTNQCNGCLVSVLFQATCEMLRPGDRPGCYRSLEEARPMIAGVVQSWRSWSLQSTTYMYIYIYLYMYIYKLYIYIYV